MSREPHPLDIPEFLRRKPVTTKVVLDAGWLARDVAHAKQQVESWRK